MSIFFMEQPKLICALKAKSGDLISLRRVESIITDSYLYCFTYSGSMQLMVDNRLVTLHKGQVLLLSLNIPHMFLNVENECYIFQIESASITTLLYKEQYFANPSYPFILTDIEEKQLFDLLCDQLIKETQSEKNSHQIIISILDCLFSFINRAVSAVVQHEDGFVSQIIKYIESHFKENITLADLSEYTNVSIYHLAHTFKEKMGISPIQYVINCRIEYAKKLLVNSQMPIIDIAYETGYDNPNYFNMLFKKICGMSPGQFRKHNKKK